MFRKLSILPTFAAMLMMMLVTVVPHHHHHAFICLVRETCEIDGCVNDEHTGHSDADSQEDEDHCITHEKYFPSDDLRVDFDILPAAVVTIPTPAPVARITIRHHATPAYASPPIITCRMRC